MSVVLVNEITGEKAFDLRVTIRDPKTGQIIKHQPYQKRVERGAKYEEYYVRDGIRYLPNGECLDQQKLDAAKQQPAKQQPQAAR
jgi:hypothetical protein